MSHQELLLHAGPLRVRLAPNIGGSIAGFTYQDCDHSYAVLRTTTGLLQNPLEAACFPLVPFCNRIADGRFFYEGQEIKLDANMAGEKYPLHGQGWLASWQIMEATDKTACLAYRHEADQWPWAYEARQYFALDPGGLRLRLECRNLSALPMPCGLGLHPYFPISDSSYLDAELGSVWQVDEDILPTENTPLDARTDPMAGPILGRGLDNGYGGWTGWARLRDAHWPYDLVMRAQGAGYFQIYAPATVPIVVAEPVSHANAALNAPPENWSALGIRLLAQGETQILDWRLEVQRKAISAWPDGDRG